MTLSIATITICVSVLYGLYSLMFFSALRAKRTYEWVTVLILIVGTEVGMLAYLYQIDHNDANPGVAEGWSTVIAIVLGFIGGYIIYRREKKQDSIEDLVEKDTKAKT